MAASVSMIDITTSSAYAYIDGMNLNYPYKNIVFYIAERGGSYVWVDTIGDSDSGYLCADGTYEFLYRNLDPGTQYDVKIVINMLVFPGGSNPFVEEAVLYSDFETEGGGGGSWSLSQTYLGNVTSETSRLEMRLDAETLYMYEMNFPYGGSVTFSSSGSADTRAWLSEYGQESWDDETGMPYDYVASDDDSGSGNNFEITYTCDANVTYYLWFRTYNGAASGAVEITISPSGGGGGWQLYEEPIGVVSSSFEFPYNSGLSGMTLYRMSITFSRNVTATFSTSGNGDTIGWLSEYYQTAWDDTSGQPTNFVANDDDSGTDRNFEFSYSCIADHVYYLWFRSYDSSGYSGRVTVSVDIGGSGTTPSYTASVANYNQISFSVSDVGNYYLRYFVRLTGDTSNVTYDTWQTYNHLTSDTSLTVTNLSYNTSYTVNVGYSTNYYDGNVTWIGSQVLTTQDAPITGWTEVYVGDVNVTTIDRSFNRSCDTMKVYRYNVRYSTGGTVRIYSTGATSSSDVIAYWGTSNNGINTSTGAPTSYSNVWDDDGSDRNFNSGEITVAANTTYYLWVRCYRDDTTAQITIYFTAPAADTGGVWIYTSSGWRKATPYIYTGSGWVKATPYVYTSSGWRKCT